jgi:hypothetical protein
MYDFYYSSRKKQVMLIVCAALVLCLLVGAVCFIGYLRIRAYTYYLEPDIILSSPDGQYELVIREEARLHVSDAAIYIRKPGQDKWYNSWKERHIGNTLSDEYLPFANGYYDVEWESNKVTIHYFQGYGHIDEDRNDRSTWQGIFVYEFE